MKRQTLREKAGYCPLLAKTLSDNWLFGKREAVSLLVKVRS